MYSVCGDSNGERPAPALFAYERGRSSQETGGFGGACGLDSVRSLSFERRSASFVITRELGSLGRCSALLTVFPPAVFASRVFAAARSARDKLPLTAFAGASRAQPRPVTPEIGALLDEITAWKTILEPTEK